MNTKNPYDGSTKTAVFIKKLRSVNSVDAAMARIKTRFDWLDSERKQLQERLSSENDDKKRWELIEEDKGYCEEQKTLIKHRHTLKVKKGELLKEQEQEIRDYQPEKISW